MAGWQTLQVHDFKHRGVTMATHNTEESITDCARASFNYALIRGWPLYFSTKDTILKACDDFMDIFHRIYRPNSRRSSTRRG